MSLINDALKKVSEAERGKPSAPQPDFETRAMQPVSYQERPAYLFWISLALFVAAIGVAGFVYAKSRTAAAQAQPIVAQTAAEIPAVATAVKEPPKVVAAQASVPAPAVVTTSNTTSTVTLAPTAQVAPAPAQPAPVIAPASPT
ncbi:MAG: hypothetical protein ACXWDN_14350, partial [Limisphaerales bacterium]